jgi:hypothetical protein
VKYRTLTKASIVLPMLCIEGLIPETGGLNAKIKRSIVALCSSVRIVTDICIYVNGLDDSNKPNFSLPATICTGEGTCHVMAK